MSSNVPHALNLKLLLVRLSKAPQWVGLLVRRLSLSADRAELEWMVASMDLAGHPTLRAVLGFKPGFHSRLLPERAKVYLGWGCKWSGRRAVAIAEVAGKDFRLVEDGFLRSVERSNTALSLILDRTGIYYDATVASELERLSKQKLSEPQKARSRAIMAVWRLDRLSKYNAAREYMGELSEPYVLVCDQTFGDASITYGLAHTNSFTRMLEAALAEYPEHQIILKTHPDVTTRGKKGYFDLGVLNANKRVRIVSDPVHPVRLLKHADAVYTVTSQLGFEALIWGKRVRCFGMPFYAGWGLTDDELPAPDRRKPVALEQLIHAALVKYPCYINPVTMQRCEPEHAFEHVGLQRRKRLEFPQQITAIGFSRWKRPFIRNFLQGSDVSFAKSFAVGRQRVASEAVAIWGSAVAPEMSEDTTLLRIEDGFLRSSGLGADLVRPLSLVIDDLGIYYDASGPSRLERILETQEIDDVAVKRASTLREKIIRLDLTKYNLGKQSWTRPDTDNPVILVVGQVETDASIRLGSPDVKTNIELLLRVRQENPSAHIVYKPHPDVVAGLRRRGKGEDASLELADDVLTGPVSARSLFAQIDALHTMTSLMGFEALLRGVKVVCHGLPFYAGWGLTEDRLSCARRTRRLTVDELVHGALVEYPRYFNHERNCFVAPEQAVDQLAAMAESGPQSRTWQRKLLRATILAWLKLRGNTR